MDWLDFLAVQETLKSLLQYHSSWPASWEICIQIKKQQLELDMKQ